MPNVIVVPETEEFQHDVSHRNLVWITKRLGVPQLKQREATYLAPFWIGEEYRGVNRLFHIVDVRKGGRHNNDATEIELGNSFVLKENWIGLGQFRRFEYHPLNVFGFIELRPGLLIYPE